MTTADELRYLTNRWIKTAIDGDHQQYLKDDAELRASRMDPLDLVASLAATAANIMRLMPDLVEQLPRDLEESDVIRRIGLDDPLERESDAKRNRD